MTADGKLGEDPAARLMFTPFFHNGIPFLPFLDLDNPIPRTRCPDCAPIFLIRPAAGALNLSLRF